MSEREQEIQARLSAYQQPQAVFVKDGILRDSPAVVEFQRHADADIAYLLAEIAQLRAERDELAEHCTQHRELFAKACDRAAKAEADLAAARQQIAELRTPLRDLIDAVKRENYKW